MSEILVKTSISASPSQLCHVLEALGISLVFVLLAKDIPASTKPKRRIDRGFKRLYLTPHKSFNKAMNANVRFVLRQYDQM